MSSHLKVIEADIEAAESQLLHKCKETEEIDSVLRIMEEKELLEGELINDRKVVEKNAEAVSTIEGIHNWKLVRADESKIAVEFLGSVPELCFRVDFSVSSSGQVDCRTRDVNKKSTKQVHANFTPSVRSFFAEKVHSLREDLSSSQLRSSSDIVENVHRIEWILGRLDIIGKELSMLEVRYSGSLKRSKTSTSHDLNLSIKNRSTETMVNTIFEIGEWYPFALDMDISGDIDVIAMERHLIRNAKPGFGYLSRACDVIAAFQGNRSSSA